MALHYTADGAALDLPDDATPDEINQAHETYAQRSSQVSGNPKMGLAQFAAHMLTGGGMQAIANARPAESTLPNVSGKDLYGLSPQQANATIETIQRSKEKSVEQAMHERQLNAQEIQAEKDRAQQLKLEELRSKNREQEIKLQAQSSAESQIKVSQETGATEANKLQAEAAKRQLDAPQSMNPANAYFNWDPVTRSYKPNEEVNSVLEKQRQEMYAQEQKLRSISAAGSGGGGARAKKEMYGAKVINDNGTPSIQYTDATGQIHVEAATDPLMIKQAVHSQAEEDDKQSTKLSVFNGQFDSKRYDLQRATRFKNFMRQQGVMNLDTVDGSNKTVKLRETDLDKALAIQSYLESGFTGELTPGGEYIKYDIGGGNIIQVPNLENKLWHERMLAVAEQEKLKEQFDAKQAELKKKANGGK